MSNYVAAKLSDKHSGSRSGMWWPMVSAGDANPRSAILYCPTCGNPMTLSQHSIDAVGNVIPSVVCPSNLGLSHGPARYREKCGFHEIVTLDGWGAAQGAENNNEGAK